MAPSENISDEIAQRLINACELKKSWQEVVAVYGQEVADELKTLTPADPVVLYMMGTNLIMDADNKTLDEALAMVENYTPDEWAGVLKHFKPTILKAFKMYEDHGDQPPKFR